MRLIDADALIKDVRENSESYFADDFAEFWVNRQPTIADISEHLVPVTKEEVLRAGLEGREMKFRLEGRRFAIRELAQ